MTYMHAEMLDLITSNQTYLLVLAALTFLYGLIVLPYTHTCYNTPWIHPSKDLQNQYHHLYYPEMESRFCFAVSLFFAASMSVAMVYLNGFNFSIEDISLLYAAIVPAYLLHRNLCFHKISEIPPVLEGITRAKVFRMWKVLLIWLFVLGILLARLFGKTPLNPLRWITIALSIVALSLLFIEVKKKMNIYRKKPHGKTFQARFQELMPSSYYAVLAVAGIILTQAALWLMTLTLLIVWIISLIIFTLIEYHYNRLQAKSHTVLMQHQEKAEGEEEKILEQKHTDKPLDKDLQLFQEIKKLTQDPTILSEPLLDRSFLADKLNTNYTYIGKAIQAGTSMTVKKYITQVRIDYACELLIQNDEYSISEIQEKCGFQSSTSFNRAFKEYIHMTPTDFRKDSKE